MSDVVVLQQGDDDDVTLPFPEALPGMTASAQVRAYPAGPVLHTWSSSNGTLIVGKAQVTLVVVDSSSWTWRSGEFDIRLDTGLQTEVAGPWKVRVRALLSGGDPGTGGGTGNYLPLSHNTDPAAHPDIRALIADGGGSGGGTETPDATTTTKGKAVLLGGTADNPTVPYGKVTGAPASLPPSGGAGGVLSGTFPNPGFAVDMTTQGEHYAHVNDSGNPHGVTKAQVGLGAVANLAPADLPVSTAVADAIEGVESAVPELAAQGIGAAVSAHNSDPAAHVDLRAALDAVAASVPEQARDALGAALVAGSNVTISPDDNGNTIAIGVTLPAAYTDEQAQDAAAALIAAGSHAGISFAYNDAGNALSATVAAQAWSQITGKPTFSTVATSGAYADLSGKPTIPTTAAGISDFTEAVQDAVAALLGAGSNVILNYDDAANSLTVSATGSGGTGLDAEQVRDAIGVALVGAGLVSVVVNDAADTITITTTATANSTDAQLRDRSTHTGMAPATSVSGLAAVATSGSYADLTAKPVTGVSSVNTRSGAVTGLAEAADVTTALAGKQAADTDLTAIAALDSTTAGAIASDGGGWIKKTYAQLKTALGLVKADVGLGAVDNTADAAKPVSTAQQTALDGKAPTTRNLAAGTGLSGGGTLAADRTFAVAYGTTAGTAAQGNDSRLSDARTPTAHTHPVTDLTATGTRDGTTFLRGDGAWATPAGGATDLRGFGVHFASQYAVVGNGTDETTKLQTALAALPVGGKLVLDGDGTATYGITAPLVLGPGRTLTALYSSTLQYPGNATQDPASPCTIKVLAGFTGVAAIRLLGKTAGGYASPSIGHRLENITIDGATGPANVSGVQAFGFVREARLVNVTARRMTNHGFDLAEDAAATGEQSRFPQSLRFSGCVADNCTGAGFSVTNVPDTTWTDCNAQGNGWHGFYLAGAQNGVLETCRAEWNGAQGFAVTSGQWGAGQGSGGVTLTSCITDRNNFNGVFVDATGGHDVVLVGCRHRRDGRASATGGYAGVFVDPAATMPVVVAAVSVKPGVGDAGDGALSPQYGISATGAGAPVTVASGEVHGAVVAFNGGTRLVASTLVATATGTTAAPTRTAPTNGTGVSAAQQTALDAKAPSIRDSAYGAKGDGVTDDSPAFAAAAAAGANVIVPPGNYRLSSLVSAGTGMRWIGQPGARLFSDTLSNLVSFSNVTDVLIEGITFESTVADATNDNYGLLRSLSSSMKRIVIRRCTFKAAGRATNGIKLIADGAAENAYDDILIDGCTFDTCGRMGFEVQDHTSAAETICRVRHLRVVGSTFRSCGALSTGIALSFSGRTMGSRAIGNTVTDSATIAIEFARDHQYPEIAENVFYGLPNTCKLISVSNNANTTPVPNMVVRNNRTIGRTGFGSGFAYLADARFTNNVFVTFSTPVDLRWSTRLRAVGEVYDGATNYAMYVESAVAGTPAQKNTWEHCDFTLAASAGGFATVRFYGAYATLNKLYRCRVVQGATGAAVEEQTGAYGNEITDCEFNATPWYPYRAIAMSDASRTLSLIESDASLINFTGTLTATRTITLPRCRRQWTFVNSTAQTLTLTAGSGSVSLLAGAKALVAITDNIVVLL